MSGKNPQNHRAGAKILKSKKDVHQTEMRRLDKQLARAADIESQLVTLASKKSNEDDDKSYKLRSHLCEILSDVLISNPRVALEKDCFQRLWRGCFYNPIRIWRQRVSREKRKRSPSLATTQEGFKHFLAEAVTLYDYLVLQYLTKLVPSCTQQSLTQTSRDTLDTSSKSQLEDTQYAFSQTDSTISSESSLEGVVHGLYKLYIFLGDLHRYSEAYNKAESNYANASKLGPGLGNPYNQLAVVAFSKDAYCVALYWYARSLLATHEKFSTSSNNMERLFAANREFLSEHGRGSAPTVFVQSGKTNKKKSADNTMLRAQKAAAIKSCLTYFVDLHYDLYQQQQQQEIPEDESDDKLREKINNVIASLRSLVQVSGFSDSLLCKIVVINTFSWERSAAGDNGSGLARDYLFSLGLVLGEQVEKLLTKSLPKAAKGKPLPSVRCLLPFEILVDFVTMRLGENQSTEKSSTEVDFWKCVSVVGSLVRKLCKTCEPNLGGTTGSSFHKSACVSQIKEYQVLKGYRPFGIVNRKYLSNREGFLTSAEAVDILELATTQASQDTSTVSGLSVGSEAMHENRARLLRMLEICQHLVLPASGAPLVLENDNYVYQDISAANTALESSNVEIEEDMNEGGDFANDSDDDASDIVLYNESEANKTTLPPQPSHVPQISEMMVEYSQQTIHDTSNDVTMTVAEEQPLPQASIKPPPGFGSPIVLPPTSKPATSVFLNGEPPLTLNPNPASTSFNPATVLPGLQPQPKNRNILDQVIQGRLPVANPSSFQLPQQQQPSMLPMHGLLPDSARNEMLYPMQSGRSNLPMSVEESIRIFGDMKTSNPFVVDPPPSAYSMPASTMMHNNQNQNYNPADSIFPNFVTEDNYANDDTKWLNSKLLDSLWMSESNKAENA
eukprot:CAMPEP_0116125980 /NCGR_PEP_ID=MMETSP0329-20121206/6092_1 /TAXON_ID=697910 /ORGANISM="Pseudo-nitzschia arenysensis, Strain B593" /LENGTH=899 /DNA_ID=CAMNT_0003620041 /DNA_START=173 /DNA_END=2872 /DNA_ORIENTATION=-